VRYIVISYGRPEVQLTLQNLPPKLLPLVELMVVPSEYRAYRRGWYADKVKSIECWPDYIDCVPKKRKWAAQNIDDDYVLIDDDLSLYVWSPRENKFVRPEASLKRFEREFTEGLPSMFAKYPGVSLGNKFMADPWVRENGLEKSDNIGFVVSGFAQGAAKDILFNRVFAFTDISLPLQVYQNTGKSVVYYGLCYNHASHRSLATTGMGTYRDDFVKIDSAIKMARMFPGIVTGVKKTNAKGGGATLTKFFSRVKRGVSEKNLEATQDFLDRMKERYRLRKLPKLFEYDDHMPRAEIIQTFKDNWKRARIK
jgi:hypothetical protein